MPSKKKARARARKTVKASRNQSTCEHIAVASIPEGDANACAAFLDDYDSTFLDGINLINQGDHSYVGLVSKFASYMSLKYNQYSYIFGHGIREEFIQKHIILTGTHRLTLSKLDFKDIIPLLYLEMQHRAFNDTDEMEVELHRVFADIIHCPRQILRFFHRRNSCNCLKKGYYELKDTTKRTAACFECGEVKDIRTLYRCSGCNVAQFCSNECSASHWPKHKKDCRRWGKCNNSGKRTAACYECGEVKDTRTLYRCSGCNVAWFCSNECATSHWPKHKKDCRGWGESDNSGDSLMKID
eukprot:scaffold52573_cov23-Cyclotella_meneghiniana.AAC.1